MIEFTATICKFLQQGEKTGWTYISIPADIAEQLNPGVRKSYRVKGFLDKHEINSVAIMPMGGGSYIMAINAAMRKGIRKKLGAILAVKLQLDATVYELNNLLVAALEGSDLAKVPFYNMPTSHQNYYSKWIESAKTNATLEKRIIRTVLSIERGISFAEMLKEQRLLK